MGAFYYDAPFPFSYRTSSTMSRERKLDMVEFGDTTVNTLVDNRWPFSRAHLDISIYLRDADEWDQFENWWEALGPATGFMVKDWANYKSCKLNVTEAFTDQIIGSGDGSTTAFQLSKTRTVGSFSNSKTILLPVTDTTMIGIRNASSGDVELGSKSSPIQWAVNTQTGAVTFDANKTASISAISQASNAQIDFTGAHGLANGETIYIASVSGMTEINGLRGTVTVVDADSVTVDINSTGFTAYTSGGTVNTLPQTGESVISGFQFYTPVRFDYDEANIDWLVHNKFEMSNIPLVELFNL